nr:E3 ubiquitin-protein ligase MIEL1-like [Ipomoea batatas]
MENALLQQMVPHQFLDEDGARAEMGCGNYGCSHYMRRCKIRAPCCDEIFDCRHCHNEAKKLIHSSGMTFLDMKSKGSFVPCATLSKMFNKDASNAGFLWGSTIAQSAISLMMMFRRINTTVTNVESAEREAKKISFTVIDVFVFDTTKNITVLPCGHTMHLECVMEMERHYQYSCPVCSKSFCDMSRVWEKLDEEVASTPMPEMYQNKMVSILCNDCGNSSETKFHVLAHKCPNCKSYNTRQTRGGATSCSSRVTEVVRG